MTAPKPPDAAGGCGRRSAGRLPLYAPTLAVGTTFGVLAEPVMGPVAPIIMSTFVLPAPPSSPRSAC